MYRDSFQPFASALVPCLLKLAGYHPVRFSVTEAHQKIARNTLLTLVEFTSGALAWDTTFQECEVDSELSRELIEQLQEIRKTQLVLKQIKDKAPATDDQLLMYCEFPLFSTFGQRACISSISSMQNPVLTKSKQEFSSFCHRSQDKLSTTSIAGDKKMDTMASKKLLGSSADDPRQWLQGDQRSCDLVNSPNPNGGSLSPSFTTLIRPGNSAYLATRTTRRRPKYFDSPGPSPPKAVESQVARWSQQAMSSSDSLIFPQVHSAEIESSPNGVSSLTDAFSALRLNTSPAAHTTETPKQIMASVSEKGTKEEITSATSKISGFTNSKEQLHSDNLGGLSVEGNEQKIRIVQFEDNTSGSAESGAHVEPDTPLSGLLKALGRPSFQVSVPDQKRMRLQGNQIVGKPIPEEVGSESETESEMEEIQENKTARLKADVEGEVHVEKELAEGGENKELEKKNSEMEKLDVGEQHNEAVDLRGQIIQNQRRASTDSIHLELDTLDLDGLKAKEDLSSQHHSEENLSSELPSARQESHAVTEVLEAGNRVLAPVSKNQTKHSVNKMMKLQPIRRQASQKKKRRPQSLRREILFALAAGNSKNIPPHEKENVDTRHSKIDFTKTDVLSKPCGKTPSQVWPSGIVKSQEVCEVFLTPSKMTDEETQRMQSPVTAQSAAVMAAAQRTIIQDQSLEERAGRKHSFLVKEQGALAGITRASRVLRTILIIFALLCLLASLLLWRGSKKAESVHLKEVPFSTDYFRPELPFKSPLWKIQNSFDQDVGQYNQCFETDFLATTLRRDFEVNIVVEEEVKSHKIAPDDIENEDNGATSGKTTNTESLKASKLMGGEQQTHQEVHLDSQPVSRKQQRSLKSKTGEKLHENESRKNTPSEAVRPRRSLKTQKNANQLRTPHVRQRKTYSRRQMDMWWEGFVYHATTWHHVNYQHWKAEELSRERYGLLSATDEYAENDAESRSVGTPSSAKTHQLFAASKVDASKLAKLPLPGQSWTSADFEAYMQEEGRRKVSILSADKVMATVERWGTWQGIVKVAVMDAARIDTFAVNSMKVVVIMNKTQEEHFAVETQNYSSCPVPKNQSIGSISRPSSLWPKDDILWSGGFAVLRKAEKSRSVQVNRMQPPHGSCQVIDSFQSLNTSKDMISYASFHTIASQKKIIGSFKSLVASCAVNPLHVVEKSSQNAVAKTPTQKSNTLLLLGSLPICAGIVLFIAKMCSKKQEFDPATVIRSLSHEFDHAAATVDDTSDVILLSCNSKKRSRREYIDLTTDSPVSTIKRNSNGRQRQAKSPTGNSAHPVIVKKEDMQTNETLNMNPAPILEDCKEGRQNMRMLRSNSKNAVVTRTSHFR